MDERDACALVAVARKDGPATREVLAETIRCLECLAHRFGSIDGEGDGAGVLTDIPRELWADALAATRLDPSQVLDRAFAVAHLFVPPRDDELVERRCAGSSSAIGSASSSSVMARPAALFFGNPSCSSRSSWRSVRPGSTPRSRPP